MYLKPSRRKKAKTRTMIVVIAAAAAAGVFAVLFFLGLLPGPGLKGGITALDFYLPDMVFSNENGILYNENDTLHLTDGEGAEEWRLGLEMAESATVASSDLICNYAGKTLQVMTYTKEQMFTTSIDSEILEAAVGKNAAAVLTSAPGETGGTQYFLTLFNTKGEQTGQIKLSARQVIEFGFYGDADMFWVLSLDSAGVLPVSYIGTYKTDGTMTYNIVNNSQIIEGVFVTDNSIYASGTNTVMSYTYFGEKQAEQQIYGWYPVAESLGTNTVRLAYVPRAGVQEIDAVRLLVTDLKDTRVRMPVDVFAVAATQDRLYGFAKDKVYVYLQDGRLDETVELETPIVKVKQLSDTCAVLWDQQKSYVMRLT